MPFVYIIKSQNNGSYYFGFSKIQKQDLKLTTKAKADTQKILRPWDLVFKQEFRDSKKAKKLEYKLKSFKSRKILEKIIKDGRIKYVDN